VIATRDDANKEYYGHPVTAKQILSGEIAPPRGAERLREVLSSYVK
jgi:lipid-binding SYLF domain-containing protein